MKEKNKYSIGTIVTLKTHPLLYNLRIKGDGKLVPPLMIVKEVFIENKNKATHSEEIGEIIADRIKYTCVFFDDNRTEFKEVVLYESMLEDYNKIFIERVDGEVKDKKNKTLIEEVKDYSVPKYTYSKILFFRTKKFEILKKRDSTKVKKIEGEKEEKVITIQNVVNYSSPEFILCGIKKNEDKTTFYSNGDLKKLTADILFKVKWFNSSQMKFSDIYLPKECFTDIQPFKSKVLYNLDEEDK